MSVKKRRKIIFYDRIIKKDDSITAQIFKKDEYMRSLGSQRMSEIGRFILVGGGSFLLDYGLLYVFTEFAGIPYLYSSALSFSVSVIINYWLCVVYVFSGARHQTMTRAILFFASSLVGLGINQACMWFFVEQISLHYMVAKIAATAIVTIWNYFAKRKAVAK